MKVSEMNEHQKKAFYNIYYASNFLLGGLENALEDNSQDSDEYKLAQATLADHDGLVNMLYSEATTTLYFDGGCRFGNHVERFLKDIRFCGKEWLLERCERRITKSGY